MKRKISHLVQCPKQHHIIILLVPTLRGVYTVVHKVILPGTFVVRVCVRLRRPPTVLDFLYDVLVYDTQSTSLLYKGGVKTDVLLYDVVLVQKYVYDLLLHRTRIFVRGLKIILSKRSYTADY